MSKRRRLADNSTFDHEIWRLVSWSAFLPFQDVVSLRQSCSKARHEARVVLTKHTPFSKKLLLSLKQASFHVEKMTISRLICSTLRSWISLVVKIQELSLQSCTIENLQGLEQCRNLEILKLYFLETPQTNLPKLPAGLKTLIIFNCNLQTITTLTQCPALQKLDLSYCDLQDVGPIGRLPNLVELDLQSCENIREVSWLRSCTRLQKLNLEGCQTLQNISGIPASVTYLNIQYCENIEDLTVFQDLENLETLCLHGPRWEYFQSCPKLANLNLSEDCTIEDLNFLRFCPPLRCLFLSNCRQLRSLQSLSTFGSKLVTLDVSGCPLLNDLSEILHCPKLKALDIQGCPLIKDRTPINNHPNQNLLVL